MKLADYIATTNGTTADMFGFAASMSKVIASGQRFDLSDDVITATTELVKRSSRTCPPSRSRP